MIYFVSNQHRKIRMHAVAREQMEKFDEYCRVMKSKVDRQREERKRYNEDLQERLRAQEELVCYLLTVKPVFSGHSKVDKTKVL